MPSTGAEPPPDTAAPPVFLAGREDLAGEVILLTGDEGKHATVRRLTPGERVDVTDGAGRLAHCVVLAARPGELELSVRSVLVTPRPEPVLVAVQALPKGDRGPLAVESLTEVGVDVIVPWQAERCVTRWRPEREEHALGRWRAVARESAKQARRAWLPEVTSPARTEDLALLVASATLAVLLDPAAAAPLARVPVPEGGRVVVIVGPEGGVTRAETTLLTGAGAMLARLGPTVLRTSTAGTAAAAVLLSGCARWRAAASP